MKIYLIRHGQTTGDVENRYGGSYDDHLTNKGEVQVHKLAGELADSGIQILLCSPLIRAQETAKILNTKFNCEIVNFENLKERNQNGVLTGMIREEAKLKYPQLTEEVKAYKNKIEGAESFEDFVKRVKNVFLNITNSAGHPTIGIVTHGGPIRVIFSEILNESVLGIADCAYAVLDVSSQKLTLERLVGIELKTN